MSNINDLLGRESLLAIKDYVDAKDNLIELTWSKLKALRDNSELAAGRFYRIIDFVTTTVQANTSSAGHVFDIIVRADSVNKLNENAYAIQHAGDTYFSNSKLESWQLKYCLDNDTTKFAWADGTNGKGVIYRLIDEFNNDVPYDFKNILFTDSSGTPKYTNAYTFSYTENNEIKDASIMGLDSYCYDNIMKKYIKSSKQQLNFNIFYSSNTKFNCYANVFGSNCYSNTFGSGCDSNTFKNGCYANTFGRNCSCNMFGDECYSNTFDMSCSNNIFKSNCSNNTFGGFSAYNTLGSSCLSNIFSDFCSSNTVGTSCSNNTFSSGCDNNTFESGCHNNTFGHNYRNNTLGGNCYYNTFGLNCDHNILGNECGFIICGDYCSCNIFGNGCEDITFGDSSSVTQYCKYNIIDNGCGLLYINGSGTASSSNQLQNIHIHLGVRGTSSGFKTITVARNLFYETNIVPTGTTIIEM